MTSPLFRPFACKSLSLANRLVMAPMTRSKSPQSIPGPDVAAYYRRRAEGGVGLIVTEGTTVDRPAATNDANVPNFHAPASLAGWRRVVEEVHAAGGRIAPQLWHQGMLRKPGTGPHPDAASDGPSGLSASGKLVGQPMSEADIADTIDAFAKAAAAAQEIGFDAVEIHGAHGYLIDQFFWEGANQRDDSWGGDYVKRTRFAAEIVRAIRARVGEAYPIILRFSQWKQQDYGARLAQTPDELATFLEPLAAAVSGSPSSKARRSISRAGPRSLPASRPSPWARSVSRGPISSRPSARARPPTSASWASSRRGWSVTSSTSWRSVGRCWRMRRGPSRCATVASASWRRFPLRRWPRLRKMRPR